MAVQSAHEAFDLGMGDWTDEPEETSVQPPDQLECTDPARNDFLEPSGDSTHLVHCKGRPRG